MSQAKSIATESFLKTGEYDPLFREWSGRDILDRIQNGSRELIAALLLEVGRRERSATRLGEIVLNSGDDSLARQRIAPMVGGLFPANEREPILECLAEFVVFLLPETIESAIRDAPGLNTAWEIANIYLQGIGGDPLSAEFPCLVGCSVGSSSYVSMRYFTDDDPLADYVVHEAAHAFHNTKRATLGLPQRDSCEWLLPIEFAKRETFAYACEAYSCITRLAGSPRKRLALLKEIEQLGTPSDPRVDAGEYLNLLNEAVSGKNGWQVIVRRCSLAAPAD